VTALALAMTAPGVAQDASPSQKAEFRKLVSERDQLHRQLVQLDRRAAASLREGTEPLGIYAEQINLEDRLDLVQLRLEMMSTRYGLPLPALPGEKNIDGVASEAESFDYRVDQAFARGRSRTRTQSRRECDQFLRSLDFSAFLDTDA
jgi:hypothetical protein